jgi:cell fate regulator YaaT (PSP1 superfamily)
MVNRQRMPVGVRFKEAGKVYYFDAGDIELDPGNYVVVETSHGLEIGRVVIAPGQVIASEIKESLKPIMRRATQEDLERSEELKKRAKEQLPVARQRAIGDRVDMRVVSADYSLDGSQLTVYFTSEDKSDFRSLQRTLSTELNVRVQFLQIGDRDRAKTVDGIGRCGERLCCSSWLTTFPSVSIRMAKEQDLPLNPSKLSGACGRLLCCLTYEFEQYRELKAGLPKQGARISTPTGDARVLKVNVLKDTILLLIEGEGPVEMPLTDFRMIYGTAVRPKELVETFERDMMKAESADAGTAPPPVPRPARVPPRRPVREMQAPPSVQSSDEQQQQQRRRRRRGGRRRRRGGGPGPAGQGGGPQPS